MLATASLNGKSPDDPVGYGLRFTKADRDRYFDRAWEDVVLDFAGAPSATVHLTPSFWQSQCELRSVVVGRWLLDIEAAPWARSEAPRIIVTLIDDNRFSVRLLERRPLGSSI